MDTYCLNSLTTDDSPLHHTSSPRSEDSRDSRDSVCTVKLINAKEPQFVIQVSVGGQWARALVDTGATLSFCSMRYALLHFKSSFKTSKSTLNIRLGDASLRPVSQYIDQTIIYNNRTAQPKLHIMNLPEGIDIIVGLDYMREMNCLLDPPNRRIILLNSEILGSDTSTAATADLDHSYHPVQPVDSFLANISEVNRRSITNDVFALSDSVITSDIMIASTNCFNKLLGQFESGTLCYESIDQAINTDHTALSPNGAKADVSAGDTAPADGGDVGSESGCCKPGTCKHSKPASKKPKMTTFNIKKRRKARKRADVARLNEEALASILKSGKDGSGQVFNGKHLAPKLNHNTKADSPKSNSKSTKSSGDSSNTQSDSTKSEPKSDDTNNIDLDEQFFLMNVIVGPRGADGAYTFTLGGEDGMNSKPEGTPQAVLDFETWHLNFMKNSATGSQYLSNLESLPPLYKGCPKNINTTEPAQADWVQGVIDGKSRKFTCMDPVEQFDPLPTDDPLNIRLKPGASAPKMHRYRCPDHLLPEFKKFIDEMVSKGWLSPSDSEWAAPILIIKKPGTYEDGSSKGFRFVSDFRKLNEVVRPLQHHMPDVVEMWEKLKDATYISVCDMRHGFWNAPLSPDSKKYAAVNTPWGTYAYNCVPQGLVNSSAYFQRWLGRKLRKHGVLYEPISVSTTPDSELNSEFGFEEGLEGDTDARPRAKRSRGSGNLKTNKGTHRGFVSIYQDDIIVFSDTPEQHRAHLLLLFKVLSEEHIPLNIKKSHLFCRYVRYLGCVVGNNHLFLDPSKCDSIHKMEVQKDATSIRGFLGLTGFYRRWIKNYADMARHLNDMLKNDVNINTDWGSD